jgi:hypothetical protein
MQQGNKRTVDGFISPRTTTEKLSPVRPATAQYAATATVITAKAPKPPHRPYKQYVQMPQGPSFWGRMQLPLILLGGMIGGFIVQTTWLGVAAIVIYGLAALILRISSRTTFSLAALSVAVVTVLLLFKPDLQLAGDFTTYTFLLLGIGVITLIIEGRPIKRRNKRNRR